jgi:hypothetical protein
MRLQLMTFSTFALNPAINLALDIAHSPAKPMRRLIQIFAAPDTSFVRHLTPLAEITVLDTELKQRCLPILGAGAADPKLWDSAVRTAGVILEERLRDVGMIIDPHAVGRDLVNKVFGKTGHFGE